MCDSPVPLSKDPRSMCQSLLLCLNYFQMMVYLLQSYKIFSFLFPTYILHFFNSQMSAYLF